MQTESDPSLYNLLESSVPDRGIFVYDSLEEFRNRGTAEALFHESVRLNNKILKSGRNCLLAKCFVCDDTREFPFESAHDVDDVDAYWRENLICPECKLSGRLRGCLEVAERVLETKPEHKVFLTEALTPLAAVVSQKFDAILSEYVSPESTPGELYHSAGSDTMVRHEDLTALSLEDQSIDRVFSFEVLEHVPDYRAAIAELYRVLKPGGRLLASAPFSPKKLDTLVRAKIDAQGNIVHLEEPEYHGDPMSEQGILSYYTFGWDILNEFRNAGFSHASIIHQWNPSAGCLCWAFLTFGAMR